MKGNKLMVKLQEIAAAFLPILSLKILRYRSETSAKAIFPKQEYGCYQKTLESSK
jgi:hypothetical protein